MPPMEVQPEARTLALPVSMLPPSQTIHLALALVEVVELGLLTSLVATSPLEICCFKPSPVARQAVELATTG